MNTYEQGISLVFMYAAGSALLLVVIGAAIMLGLSIYDVWKTRGVQKDAAGDGE